MSERVISQNYVQDITRPGLPPPTPNDPNYSSYIDIQHRLKTLLRRQTISFPGSQPVSFARQHLEELKTRDYYVCEKSDGIRYLLYLTSELGPDGQTRIETPFLIDRKNQYWFISTKELHFPLPNDPNPANFHVETLIDGELVMDVMEDGSRIPYFLVFDCLTLDGQSLMQRTLDKRLAYFQEKVLNPQKALLNKYPEEKAFQPFVVRMKSMQFAYGIELMFTQILPSLRHQNDGLIFTCTGTEYKFGTDEHILKWKPAEDNTVDFRWKLEFHKGRAPDNGEILPDFHRAPKAHLYVYSARNIPGHPCCQPFLARRLRGKWFVKWGELYLPQDEWDLMMEPNFPLDERIVEGHLDEMGRWRFIRFRDDKEEANHVNTATSVMHSIRDAVTKEELLQAAPLIKERWKARQEQAKQARRPH